MLVVSNALSSEVFPGEADGAAPLPHPESQPGPGAAVEVVSQRDMVTATRKDVSVICIQILVHAHCIVSKMAMRGGTASSCEMEWPRQRPGESKVQVKRGEVLIFWAKRSEGK